ncbi:MAG TPA: hypothetical protein VHL34_00120, partial [Rhizomicrobium sp.]|nr:hypothetical protein [Rhizomicrobium sp.]
MIVVVHPRREVIRRLQAAETHYYFSIAAESVIRRHGLINVESVDETTVAARKGHVPVLTRSTFANPDILLDGVAAFEAPLHPGMSKRLGLSGETAAFETLTVRSCRTGDSWTVFRPYIEKTPAAESERVTPWTNRAIGVELFDGITSDVAMDMILPDGRTFPAVFRHGRAWVCAFPIFDLIAEHFAVPPLDQRYAACTRMEELNTLADTVLRGLIEHAERNPDFQSVRCARWPEGYNSAFAIRHDYDRPISDTALASLLALHQKTGLKCSVGILAYETPSDQIAALVERGHEIQFHAFESSYHDLRTHLSSLTEVVGRRIRGATVHGGASGPGFRGDKHISWFERAGFRYTETFQIDGYPSP